MMMSCAPSSTSPWIVLVLSRRASILPGGGKNGARELRGFSEVTRKYAVAGTWRKPAPAPRSIRALACSTDSVGSSIEMRMFRAVNGREGLELKQGLGGPWGAVVW